MKLPDDWRSRRKLSYLMHDFDDRNLPYVIKNEPEDQLVMHVLCFFRNGSELEYPAKSYFVAIIYAKLLEKFFHVNFYVALSQPDLLPDDISFVPYEKGKNVYDAVLRQLPLNYINLPSVQKTKRYFMEEFLIGVDC